MSEKRSLIEQMLEHLVNDEQQKAEELFHEYVVKQSREIYENLIESEMSDEDEDEDEVDEGFDDEETFEADDEMDLDSEDPTDDLAGDMGDDMDDMDDMDGDKDPAELFQDLDSIVDELQAKFDAMQDGSDMGDDDMGDDDMGDDDMGDDEEMKDDFELETVREYVEKVPAGHGAEKKGAAEKADNKRSTIDNMKNDMGGTTANILSGRNGADAGEANKGQLKGSGLLKGSPQDMKTGNINVPGGKAGGAFSKKEPGHGAEKKGASEGSTDGQSLFRGRR
jgi:hypothetical protein